MFTCYVRYSIVKKEDIIKVIDNLSVYGTVMVHTSQDGRTYHICQPCTSAALEQHLTKIRALQKNGVSIQNVTTTIQEG